MGYNQLTPQEREVIEDKATERAFTGEYDNFYAPGTFICRRCNFPLFSSQAKFDAHCGWPSFEASFPNALNRLPGTYGRTEVECAHCHAHLGHEFEGEGFTDTNTRQCVNSVAIKFIPDGATLPPILNSQN
jgi:methionine-R-sulfoxide reductase